AASTMCYSDGRMLGISPSQECEPCVNVPSWLKCLSLVLLCGCTPEASVLRGHDQGAALLEPGLLVSYLYLSGESCPEACAVNEVAGSRGPRKRSPKKPREPAGR